MVGWEVEIQEGETVVGQVVRQITHTFVCESRVWKGELKEIAKGVRAKGRYEVSTQIIVWKVKWDNLISLDRQEYFEQLECFGLHLGYIILSNVKHWDDRSLRVKYAFNDSFKSSISQFVLILIRFIITQV